MKNEMHNRTEKKGERVKGWGYRYLGRIAYVSLTHIHIVVFFFFRYGTMTQY